jgi:regulator of sirC expression with transglutaminase-like and TPR domain
MEPDNQDPAAWSQRALLSAFGVDVVDGSDQPPASLGVTGEPPELSVDLDEAALLLSAVLRPDVDVMQWLVVLDELAAQCPAPTREGIIAFIIESGFKGPGDDYGRWQHSCLDHVLETRVGLPITLAIIAIELGRRLGVELSGIGMPAHFLVGDPNDPDWFADPFHGVEHLDRRGCQTLFHELIGDRLHWSDGLLAPVGNRQIMLRVLNNLKGGCQRFGSRIEFAQIMAIRVALPEFAHERREWVRSLAVFN